MGKKLIAVCNECNGTDLVFDTTAMWSAEEQKFVAADEVQCDYVYCRDCGAEPSRHWSWQTEYTVWAIEKSGLGTMWISTIRVPADAAEVGITTAARAACAADWGWDPDDIHILGAAQGDTTINFWNDLSE